MRTLGLVLCLAAMTACGGSKKTAAKPAPAAAAAPEPAAADQPTAVEAGGGGAPAPAAAAPAPSEGTRGPTKKTKTGDPDAGGQ